MFVNTTHKMFFLVMLKRGISVYKYYKYFAYIITNDKENAFFWEFVTVIFFFCRSSSTVTVIFIFGSRYTRMFYPGMIFQFRHTIRTAATGNQWRSRG